MGSMRQRLLLVAGWVAAAVVATLVSTGAVAVAGGQVADRPLPALSASEVAAPAEECGSSDRAPCLRQLDGSEAPTTTVAAAPEILSPEGDGQGVSPGSTSPSDPLVDEPPDPVNEFDGSPLPPDDEVRPEPRGEVVTLIGASVGFSGAEGEVRIIWAIPRPGFALLPPTDAKSEDGSVTVVFSDGSHRSTLVARWDEVEGLIIETTEGRVE